MKAEENDGVFFVPLKEADCMSISMDKTKITLDMTAANAEIPKRMKLGNILKIWRISEGEAHWTLEVMAQFGEKEKDSSLSINFRSNDQVICY